jgi:predicted lipid-binding transport protein (Tim44 family)
MKRLFAFALTLFISFALVTTDAEARRFGGGGNIGKQRQSYSQQQATPQRSAPAAPAAPAPGGNRWLGPLAGLAAGGLLASMFMGGGGLGGMGGGMNILLMLAIAAGIFFLFRAMRRNAPAPQPMQYAGGPAAGYNPPIDMQSSASPVQASSIRPAWFEDEPFLREAKVHFIRLQAAYDSGDLNDIREYTTPEMFAEISMQIKERGDAKQKTDVVTLEAQMIEVVTESSVAIASVRFSGLIREDEGGKAEPFNEIWHVHKSLAQANSPWLVAGIQQAQ